MMLTMEPGGHIIGKCPLRISPSAGTVERKNAHLNTNKIYNDETKTVETAVTKYMLWAFETTLSFRTNHLHLKKTLAC